MGTSQGNLQASSQCLFLTPLTAISSYLVTAGDPNKFPEEELGDEIKRQMRETSNTDAQRASLNEDADKGGDPNWIWEELASIAKLYLAEVILASCRTTSSYRP